VAILSTINGCNQPHSPEKPAKPSKEEIYQEERRLIASKYPDANEFPNITNIKYSSFTIELQRRFRALQGKTLYAFVELDANVIERNGFIFFEGSLGFSNLVQIRLKDSNGLTESLISSKDKLKQGRDYAVAFVFRDLLQPNIQLRSEITHSSEGDGDDSESEITFETNDFAIILGDLIYIKRLPDSQAARSNDSEAIY
jgi:hypothetical protein